MSFADFHRSVLDFLQFLHDERGTNVVKSFAALSQAYVDLRSASLHGVAAPKRSAKRKDKDECSVVARSSSSDDGDDDGDDQGAPFSIAGNAAAVRDATRQKIAAVSARADTVWSACAPLLSEMNNLLLRVKQRAFGLEVELYAASAAKGSQEQQARVAALSAAVQQIVLRLQTKMVTTQLLFKELRSALQQPRDTNSNSSASNDGALPSSSTWDGLTVEQLRVYQMSLVAEFAADASAAVAGAVAQHPLETLPLLLERVKAML
jgi:hypothetical protein